MKKRKKSKAHPEWTPKELLMLKMILSNESESCQQYKLNLKAILSK
ncbi:hypothetical protein [Brevibacillus formosus]